MTCPTPSKAAYATHAEAVTAAARIRADERGPALVPYPCPGCPSYHLRDPAKQNLTRRIRAALGGHRD